jgi:hypothetical protein
MIKPTSYSQGYLLNEAQATAFYATNTLKTLLKEYRYIAIEDYLMDVPYWWGLYIHPDIIDVVKKHINNDANELDEWLDKEAIAKELGLKELPKGFIIELP